VKRYGQRCSVARALDVVGDRWSLLVIRELIVGPRRYTDLKDGLPGIGTNVLAGRLRDLLDAGVVVKHELPVPTSVVVYELTTKGRSLEPTLAALRTWGEEYGPPWQTNDAVRPAWVLMSAIAKTKYVTPGKVCELRVDSEVFQLISNTGTLSLRSGSTRPPDAIITLSSEILFGVAVGFISADAAQRQAAVEGDGPLAFDIFSNLFGTVTGMPAGQPIE
jgi:DNA-binding HxlR family transcriptional regulator